jgi:hypothetical protein
MNRKAMPQDPMDLAAFVFYELCPSDLWICALRSLPGLTASDRLRKQSPEPDSSLASLREARCESSRSPRCIAGGLSGDPDSSRPPELSGGKV